LSWPLGVATASVADDTRTTAMLVLEQLVKRDIVGTSAFLSFARFAKIRSQVVHGSEVIHERDVLRAIDSGLDLLRVLRLTPAEVIRVAEGTVTVYSDQQCTKEVPSVRGLWLEYVSPGTTMRKLWPIPGDKHYMPGQIVTKKWDIQRPVGQAFYRSDDGPKLAWQGAAMFTGEPVIGLATLDS
jgi:hypothetical protein